MHEEKNGSILAKAHNFCMVKFDISSSVYYVAHPYSTHCHHKIVSLLFEVLRYSYSPFRSLLLSIIYRTISMWFATKV